jgi:UDP-glucuronate 4-epimerase
LWDGHLARPNYCCKRSILEGCRHSKIEHLVFASSCSVYGTNTKFSFAVSANVDRPFSIYAATKKAKELMAHSYSLLYNLSITGLRFFTVYGLGGGRIWLISNL